MNENCTVLQSRLTSFKVIKVWFHSQKLFWILLHNSIQVVQDGSFAWIIQLQIQPNVYIQACKHDRIFYQDVTQHYLYPEITFYKNLSLGLQIKVHRYKKSFYVKLNWSCSCHLSLKLLICIYTFYIYWQKLELSENSLLLSSYTLSLL